MLCAESCAATIKMWYSVTVGANLVFAFVPEPVILRAMKEHVVDEFWGEAVRVAASGEPAMLVTVMAVGGTIAAAPGSHMLVTGAGTAGTLDGGAADSVIAPLVRETLGS